MLLLLLMTIILQNRNGPKLPVGKRNDSTTICHSIINCNGFGKRNWFWHRLHIEQVASNQKKETHYLCPFTPRYLFANTILTMKKTHFSFLAKVNLIVLLILGLAISFFYFREEKREEMACYQMIKKQTQVVADMLRRCNSVSQIQSLLNDIQTCWKDLLHLQLIDTQGNIVAATQKKEMGYKTRAQETGFSFPIKNSFFQGTMKVYIASADICENFLKNKAERRNEAILTFIVALTVFTTLTYIVVTRYENTIIRKTAERLKAENALMTEKIKQSERLAVLGRMAASLAHEIRTPLTSIKNLAQLLEEEYADPAFRKEFQELVVSEVERINRIIKALLTYAKPLNLQKGRVRLDNLIEETLAGLKEAGQMEKIRIKKVEDRIKKLKF